MGPRKKKPRDIISQVNSRIIRDQASMLDVDTLASSILACKPQGASGAYAFKWAYLEEEILSKLPRPGISAAARYNAAVDKMMLSEARCKALNAEGFNLTQRSYYLLERAKDLIWSALGQVPRTLFETAAFSGGATTNYPRKYGDPFFKYLGKGKLGVTPSAYNYAYALITATPVWCASGGWHKLQLRAGNSVFTVPKSTEIDRAACKEPCMNMALQKAVGNYIRKRLREVCAIDLNDQTMNQTLAAIGSHDGSLATIDLSSASDSISCYLVDYLLPGPWADILNRLRSPGGWVRLRHGESRSYVKWEKHSTMGNGYTFELESLIFWALVTAACEVDYPSLSKCKVEGARVVSIYGDDIICPVVSVERVVHLLSVTGFSVNEKKSFWSGPFRESCGKHYYSGVDVTPFYIRKPIDSINRVIWLLNALRRWAADEDGIVVDPSVYSLWKKVRRVYVPSRFLGGDSCETTTSVASPHGLRDRVGIAYKMKKIQGDAAYLRCLQYSSVPAEFAHVRWYESDELYSPACDHDSLKFSRIPNADKPYFRVMRNKRTTWVKEIPLFPEELLVRSYPYASGNRSIE